MRTRYALVLTIFFFGSFAHAQVKSQMHLTTADSLFQAQPFLLNQQDFSLSVLEAFQHQLKPLDSIQQSPDGFAPLMPILKPDDSFEYKMRYLDRNDPYQYTMPILEPIMINRYYQS